MAHDTCIVCMYTPFCMYSFNGDSDPDPTSLGPHCPVFSLGPSEESTGSQQALLYLFWPLTCLRKTSDLCHEALSTTQRGPWAQRHSSSGAGARYGSVSAAGHRAHTELMREVALDCCSSARLEGGGLLISIVRLCPPLRRPLGTTA